MRVHSGDHPPAVGRPLLIDQAEDNLDNAYIYTVLVRRIVASVKAGRQIILVTHNPNPPVLCEAGRIIMLANDEDGHGGVAAAGTFDEVLAHVETLEGGRDAFLERGERYGHSLRDNA